jgi:hypothetical protein
MGGRALERADDPLDPGRGGRSLGSRRQVLALGRAARSGATSSSPVGVAGESVRSVSVGRTPDRAGRRVRWERR